MTHTHAGQKHRNEREKKVGKRARKIIISFKEDMIMGFKSDIEIAQECTMEPITNIAEKAGIDDKYLNSTESTKQKLTTIY